MDSTTSSFDTLKQALVSTYISEALRPKAQALSTYEKECIAVILAVTKWKPYLQHKEFTILTDRKSLIHLGEQKLHEGMQQQAFIKLLGLQYKIQYKKGLENKAADALSRQPETLHLNAVSTSTPKWLEIIVDGYTKDDATKQLLTELTLTGSNDRGFTLSDGIIKYKNRIWLGNHTEAHQAVLLALHSSGLGGHSGITATYNKIIALFAWSQIKKSVQDYIHNCEVCARLNLNIADYLVSCNLFQYQLTVGIPLVSISSMGYPNPETLILFQLLSTN